MTLTPTKSRQRTIITRSMVASSCPFRLHYNALPAGTKRRSLPDQTHTPKRNHKDRKQQQSGMPKLPLFLEPSQDTLFDSSQSESPRRKDKRDAVTLDNLGWPLIGTQDESKQPSDIDTPDSPFTSFLVDRPSRRQLFGLQCDTPAAMVPFDPLEDDEEDRVSRRSVLFEAVLGEGCVDEAWPTSPTPRIHKPASRLVREDTIDEFFSRSHVDDDMPTERFSSPSVDRLRQPHHKHQRPGYISRQPHFFTRTYFENHSPRSCAALGDDESEEEADPSPLSATTYFEASFNVLGLLGSGDFADVYKAVNPKTGQLVAIKRTKAPFCGYDDRWQQIIEVAHMQDVKGSPHCVEIVQGWEDQGHLFIEMELCMCGNLANYIVFQDYNIPEDTIWHILYKTSLGVRDIHHANIIHLDIKPSNILIDQRGAIKIGDFGVSVRYPVDLQWVKGEGDRRYMAPDLLRDQFNKPVDVFSLGMVVLEMVTGLVLPDTGTAWENLRVGDFSDCEEELGKASTEMRAMVEWLLTSRPEDRPSIDAVLKHKRLMAIADSKQNNGSSESGTDYGILWDYARHIEALQREQAAIPRERNMFCTPQSQIASPLII